MKIKVRAMTNTERARFLAKVIVKHTVAKPRSSVHWEYDKEHPASSYEEYKLREAFKRIGADELKIVEKFVRQIGGCSNEFEEFVCLENVERTLNGKTAIEV